MTSAGTRSPDPPEAEPAPRRRLGARIELVVVATLVCGLALFSAGLVGYGLAGDPAPSDTSAEAGFARDMQTHHQQAVQMSFLIRDRSDDPTIRTIAYDIITSQQQQAGQMYGWLVQWDLPQTSPAGAMSWMTGSASMPGMSMPNQATPGTGMPTDALMPGMATPSDIQSLQRATGTAAERIFLRLMIAHHQGGVMMAKAVLSQTQRPEVRTLASSIVTAQQTEIVQMQSLLDRRTT